MNGIELITAERERQVSQEGWTASHDDAHQNGELAKAAACYALSTVVNQLNLGGEGGVTQLGRWLWPWVYNWWKPTTNIRDLVKAGALIAAEIDRLQRLDPQPEGKQ